VLTPVSTANITNATAISAGVTNTCALLGNGTVSCWGPNSHAELGNGSTTDSATPVPVTGVAGATAIAIGGSHACAVVANGEVMCWGDNNYGQVARNSKTGPDQCGVGTGISCSKLPIKVAGITGAVDVAAGDSHSCAILADGRTKCWGWNGYGQLGNGGMLPVSPLPQWVTRKAIAVGGNFLTSHACALYGAGSIKCWGANGNGALGNGQTSNSQGTPVQVSGITNAVTVSAGGHTCATLDDGSMSCWGANVFRQIGPNATQPNQLTPLGVGLPTVAVSMAGRASTCAIRADQGGMRKLICFGVNNNMQLGVSNSGMPLCSGPTVLIPLACQAAPIEVPGLAVISVAGGAEHTCAVLDDGTARCWGQNLFSQLGSNAAGLIKVVPGIASALAIAVGSNHNCALIADGIVKCWGRNRFGQLGDGTLTESATPVTVAGITNATAVIASGESSCALLADGAIKCWGDNGVGQLGTGTTTGPDTCASGGSTSSCSKTPVAVSVINDATAISSTVQAGNTCAVRANGDVFCWGTNGAGELGRGNSGGTSPTPAAVIGL
jgi:alpha-tubulin suppressor-like RCC1 family protein